MGCTDYGYDKDYKALQSRCKRRYDRLSSMQACNFTIQDIRFLTFDRQRGWSRFDEETLIDICDRMRVRFLDPDL